MEYILILCSHAHTDVYLFVFECSQFFFIRIWTCIEGVVYKWRKTQFYVKIGETMCKRIFVVSRSLTCKWIPFRYYIESFYTEYAACVSMWHLSCTIGLWYPPAIYAVISICTETYTYTQLYICWFFICNSLFHR